MIKTLYGLYVGLAGIVLVSLYCFINWSKTRASFPKETAFNEFPSKDISPGGLRHIYTNGFDVSARTLTSLLAGMAIKGYLLIIEEGKTIRLKKTGRDSGSLTDSEKLADECLFKGGNEVLLDGNQNEHMGVLYNKLWKHYDSKYKWKYYGDKLKPVVFALTGSIAALVVCGMAEQIGNRGFAVFQFVFNLIWLSGWTAGCAVFGVITVLMWYSVFTSKADRKSSFQIAVFLTLFMTPFYWIEVNTLLEFRQLVSLWLLLVFLFLALINIVFALKLKVFTEEGKTVTGKILLLKHRFSVRSQDRLLTAKTLEMYLPYALALNFEKDLTMALKDSNVGSFVPGWFKGEVKGDFVIYFEHRMREQIKKAAFKVKFSSSGVTTN